ncbi:MULTISPECIES: hypothetical protein [Fusobacterium]|jgi:putative uncharacterized protein FNV2142|uniref:hypothetical protein n=1 Tax=Fusobacterium TaxID=848 RepID=UPI00044B5B57|nr:MULTISPECIES: hypothetical protein [Fusobacterium]EUB33220.1 hypothetical protein HMPREF1501_0119 [Fusobacterium sp. OBRC1]WRL72554.1 hypothetical protein VKN77_09550 [Fusobacterium polymorphum]
MELNEEQSLLVEELKEILGIETISNNRKYWMVRAGVEGVFFYEFFTRKFIGINVPVGNNLELLKKSNIEDLKEIIAKESPKEIKNVGHLATKVYNFFNEIKKGDIIVMPSYRKERIAFGIVENENIILDDSLYLNESIKAAKNLTKENPIPDKRMEVKWIKLVKGSNLPGKLLLSLIAPHGLSAITDNNVIDLINTAMDTFFIKNETAYMTFDVRTESDIDLKDIANYFSTVNEVVDFTNEYFKDDERINLKINLNSPGTINFIGPAGAVLIAGVLLAVLGCDFEINVFNIIKFKAKTKGLLAYIQAFFDQHNKSEDRKLEYKKTITNLEVKEPEKLKRIIEILNSIDNPEKENRESNDPPVNS